MKQIIRYLSFFLALLMLTACGSQVPPEDKTEDVTTAAPETEPPVAESVLMEGGVSTYALVRGEKVEKAINNIGKVTYTDDCTCEVCSCEETPAAEPIAEPQSECTCGEECTDKE